MPSCHEPPATALARELWRRNAVAPVRTMRPGVALEAIAERLALLLHAAFDRDVPIVAARQPSVARALHALTGRADVPGLPGTDGEAIHLPHRLDGRKAEVEALYRALALQQAARVMRGTARLDLRREARTTRSLYLLCEVAAIDAWLVRRFPGVADALRALRDTARARCTAQHALADAYRILLRAPAAVPPECFAACTMPQDSLQRARALQATDFARARPLPADSVLGELLPAVAIPAVRAQVSLRDARPERDDATQVIGQRAADALAPDDAPRVAARRGATTPRGDEPCAEPERFHYPEWDARRRAYTAPRVWVHIRPPVEDDCDQRHDDASRARMTRAVERLRDARVPRGRQPDGPEPDTDALVERHADCRAGRAGTHRVYVARRRATAGAAVLLLVDHSNSTARAASHGRRLLDVAKAAAVVLADALATLRMPCAIAAFAGLGPYGVMFTPLKRFDEPHDDRTARRIGALEPDGCTRLGAVTRHATALIAAWPARRRLLLVLSDGRPSDIDEYAGDYGIEDSARALHEARMQGVTPFCLAVDDHAAPCLPRLFGAGRFRLLPDAAALPAATIAWLRGAAR